MFGYFSMVFTNNHSFQFKMQFFIERFTYKSVHKIFMQKKSTFSDRLSSKFKAK